MAISRTDPLYTTGDPPPIGDIPDPMAISPGPAAPAPDVAPDQQAPGGWRTNVIPGNMANLDVNQVVSSLSPPGIAAQTGAAALSNFGAGPGVGFQSYQPPTETPPWPEQILEDNPELPTDPNFENAFISPVHLSNDQANTVLAQLDENRHRNAGDAIRQQYPPRAVPPIGQTPQTPENMIRHAIGAFTNPLMLMALVGGALTKQGARGALAAGTGVLQGLNEANLQKAYLQNQKFRNSIKDTAAAEGAELADINAVLNSGKSMEEQQNLLDVIAQQHNDPTLSQMARQNFGQLPQFVAGRQKVLDGLHKSTRGLSKTQERLAQLEQQQEGAAVKPDPLYEPQAQEVARGNTDVLKNFTPKDRERVIRRANKIAEGLSPEERASKVPKKAAEIKAEKDETDAKKIADGIASGKVDPRAPLYRLTGPVEAELSSRGFDLAGAKLEWNVLQRQIGSLNGPQMTRFIGLSRSVISTIDEVKNLAMQRDQGNIAPLNALELRSAAQFRSNEPEGQLAIRYITAINTLKEEFANLAQGGYAPTESVWALANRQINENFGQKGLEASLDEVQKLIKFRLNAIPNINVFGPGAPNRYSPQPPQAEPPLTPSLEGWH